MGSFFSKIAKFFGGGYIDSAKKEFIDMSTSTEQFLSSIDECVEENQSGAKLLNEAVTRYKNGEPVTRVQECFEMFQAQYQVKYLNTNNDLSKHLSIIEQHIQKILDLKIRLDKKLGILDCWRELVNCVFNISELGSCITKIAMVAHPKVAEVLQQVDVVIKQLQSKIEQVFDKCKKSYEGDRNTIVELLLDPAIDQLINIRGLMHHASAAIGESSSIKARVHEQVKEFNMKLADGNDEDAKLVIDRIDIGIKDLQTNLEDLEGKVKRCRKGLNKSVKNVEEYTTSSGVSGKKVEEYTTSSGVSVKTVEEYMQLSGVGGYNSIEFSSKTIIENEKKR